MTKLYDEIEKGMEAERQQKETAAHSASETARTEPVRAGKIFEALKAGVMFVVSPSKPATCCLSFTCYDDKAATAERPSAEMFLHYRGALCLPMNRGCRHRVSLDVILREDIAGGMSPGSSRIDRTTRYFGCVAGVCCCLQRLATPGGEGLSIWNLSVRLSG